MFCSMYVSTAATIENGHVLCFEPLGSADVLATGTHKMLQLPVELIFEVLSHLSLQNLGVLPLICREWREFMKENESTIYHNAAQLHNFVPASSSSQRLHEALKELYSQKSLRGVNSWKELCTSSSSPSFHLDLIVVVAGQRRLQIKHSWLGKAPSRIVQHRTSPNRRVHRIKVDESAGFIITTSRRGGLAVTDINTDELLWSLPEVCLFFLSLFPVHN